MPVFGTADELAAHRVVSQRVRDVATLEDAADHIEELLSCDNGRYTFLTTRHGAAHIGAPNSAGSHSSTGQTVGECDCVSQRVRDVVLVEQAADDTEYLLERNRDAIADGDRIRVDG
jgi:hypothetical protein